VEPLALLTEGLKREDEKEGGWSNGDGNLATVITP